jgi:hypothetical protein
MSMNKNTIISDINTSARFNGGLVNKKVITKNGASITEVANQETPLKTMGQVQVVVATQKCYSYMYCQQL